MQPIREVARAAALAAIIVGCSERRESPEAFEVKAAVRRYNEALPQAYARQSAGLLAGAATGDEMQRLDDIVNFLAQGKRVMDARQESFEAGQVAFPAEGRAEVEAEEVWWYRHWVPSTGEVKQAPRRVRYKNLYRLVRVEGRWLVDRLEERGYKQLE
jgi:hypothetical protein